MKKFIRKEIIEAVHQIAKDHPKTVFCGSLGLVFNGMLKRDVKDIDLITCVDYYSPVDHTEDKTITSTFYPKYRWNGDGLSPHSEEFMVGVNKVKCFKLYWPGEVKVDVLFNTGSKPDWRYADFFGETVRIETPGSAIDAKLRYVAGDRSVVSVGKHLKDLIDIGADRHLISEAISESVALNPSKSDVLRQKFLSDEDLPL